MEEAHAWQVKFYCWLFLLNGMVGVVGKIEYPRLRKTTAVFLTETDKRYLEEIVPKISALVKAVQCPPLLEAKICKKCSYYELCYIDGE